MINEQAIQEATSKGLPTLKDLFNNLPKDDALKGLGILAIMGITGLAYKTIVDIVKSKV